MSQMKQTDNVLDILQWRETRSDALVKENREDIVQFQSQLNELVQGMTRLSDDIRALDADIKGENKGKGEKDKGRGIGTLIA